MDVLKPVPMRERIDETCASEVIDDDELRTQTSRLSNVGVSFKRPSNTDDLTDS